MRSCWLRWCCAAGGRASGVVREWKVGRCRLPRRMRAKRLLPGPRSCRRLGCSLSGRADPYRQRATYDMARAGRWDILQTHMDCWICRARASRRPRRAWRWPLGFWQARGGRRTQRQMMDPGARLRGRIFLGGIGSTCGAGLVHMREIAERTHSSSSPKNASFSCDESLVNTIATLGVGEPGSG